MVKNFLILIFLFSLSFLIGSPVFATTIISPLVEIEVEPGTTGKGVVKVYNETEENLYLVASVEEYKKDEQNINLNNNFLDWFSLESESMVLLPKQVIVMPFDLIVPINAMPGGYYSVIYWKTVSGPQALNGQLNISGKVGTLVFVKVKGDIKEIGEVSNFVLNKNINFYYGFPLNFSFNFNNLGNIHLEPEVKIEITDWFGQKQYLNFDKHAGIVFPEKEKRYELVWGKKYDSENIFYNYWKNFKEELNYLSFGKLNAKLIASYGLANKEEVLELNFWFIPKNLLIGLGLIIFSLFVFLSINIKIKKIKQKTDKIRNDQKK